MPQSLVQDETRVHLVVTAEMLFAVTLAINVHHSMNDLNNQSEFIEEVQLCNEGGDEYNTKSLL